MRIKPTPSLSVIDRNHPLARGLLAWWVFNEGGGARVFDYSRKYHGTLTGMDPATDWVRGPRGSALDFDGTDDRIEASSNLIQPTTSMSIALWVRVTSFAAQNYVMAKGLNSTTWQTYRLRVETSGRFNFSIQNDSLNQFPAWEIPVTLSVNTWYHVVFCLHKMTGTSGDVTGFLNGIQRTLTYSANGYNSSFSGLKYSQAAVGGSTRIGSGHNGTGVYNPLIGRVDDARLWQRGLTPSEVKSMYDRPFELILFRRPLSFVPSAGTLFFQTLTEGLSQRDTMNLSGGKVTRDGAKIPDALTRSIATPYEEIQEVLSTLINTANITQLNAQDLISSIQSQINTSQLDVLGLPEALTKAVTTAKTETFSIRDSVVKLAGIVQLITFLASDRLALQASLVPSEQLRSDDSMRLDPSKTPADGMDVSDLKALDSSKSLSDDVGAFDSNVLDSSKAQRDGVSDSDSNELSPSKNLLDDIEGFDSAVLDSSKVRVDGYDVSDSAVLDSSKAQADGYDVSDSDVLDSSKNLSDDVGTLDSNVLDSSKSLSDDVESFDSKVVLLSLFMDDAQQFNDSASLLAFITELSQAASSEGLSLDGQLIRSASVNYQDRLNNSVSVTLGEILSLLDAIQTSFLQFVSLLDGIAVSSSMSPVIGKAPIDTASLLDSLTSAMTTAVTETISWLPYLNYLTATTKTDADGFVDTLVLQTVESLIDGVEYDDTIRASITVLRSDITTLLDTVAKTTFETFSETFQLSDAVTSSVVTLIVGHVSAILVKTLYDVDIAIKPAYSVNIEVK
jgi:hypothetical protein